MTTVQLWERIHATGLASPEECRQWARTVAETSGKSASGDPQQLLASLISLERLTPYQANVLYRELPQPLMLEGIRIVRSMDQERGPYWYEGIVTRNAAVVRGKENSDATCWVVAIPSSDLTRAPYSLWPPSMLWSQRNCQVGGSQLDCWQRTGATMQYLYAVMEPLPGDPLPALLENQALDPVSCERMVCDIAKALDAMHRGGLVHGRVVPQAVMSVGSSGFFLQRDPWFPPNSPYRGPFPSVLIGADDLLCIAAPELSHPEAVPTPQSDLYALGCLWYRCLTGQWPFNPAESSSLQKWQLLHAQVPVRPCEELSEEANRCLMHLLAKDPRRRFDTAADFLTAMTPEASPISPEVEVSASSKPESVGGGTSQAEQLAAEMREKKSKLGLRYHQRPFGATNPKQAKLNSGATPEAPRKSSSAPATVPKASVESASPAPSPSSAPAIAPVPVTEEPAGATSASAKPKPVPEKPLPAKPVSVGTRTPSDAAPSKTPEPLPIERMPISPSTFEPVGSSPSALKNQSSTSPSPTEGARKPRRKVKKSAATQGKPRDAAGADRKKGKRKAKRPVWFMPLTIAGSFLFLIVLILMLRQQSGGIVKISAERNAGTVERLDVTAPSVAATVESKVQAGIDPLVEYFEIKNDDGVTPWTPPTVGAPYSLEMLPMGPEALVFVSDRVWRGDMPFAAVEEWWKSLQVESDISIPEASWVNPLEYAYVTLAWYPSTTPGEFKRVVRFASAEPKLLSEWGRGIEGWTSKSLKAAADGSGGTLWVRDDQEGIGLVADDFVGKPDAMVKRVTIGPTELLEAMVETRGASGPIRRQMDVLLQNTDRRADITLLAAPSFLYGDGKGIFGSHTARVLPWLKAQVGDKVQAVMVRTHFEPQWYVEWRTLSNDLQAASRQASELKAQIEALPDAVESGLVLRPADPYWRGVAVRFPQMLRALSRYVRAAAEDGQVVVNAYLPKEAMLNLVVSSWMAMGRDEASNISKITQETPKPEVVIKTAEQWLDSKITLRIDQDSLENVLQSIATEVKDANGEGENPLSMSINGTAFQKDGITRNQEIRGFEFQDETVRKVLTKLARRANPVTTVQSPNEKDQKVVWVLLDEPSSTTKKKIEFTTRTWADANAAVLPPEFQLP